MNRNSASSTTAKPVSRRLAMVIMLGVLTLSACGKKQESPEKASAEQPTEKKALDQAGHPAENLIQLGADEAQTAGLRTALVQERDVSEHITATATIQPNQNRLAHVAPLIPGRLTRVTANLGDRVKKGQVLATVNSVEAGQARATYQQAQSELSLAQANFERAERLFKQQIVAQKDYLKARADLQQAQANLRAARERLHTYGVTAKSSGEPSVVPVTAPIAGTVIEKKAVIGELAGPDQPLFTVADLSTLWIETDIYEKDLGKLQPGSPATVTVAAYPGEPFKGQISYLSPAMDPETRTVKARVEVANPDGRLRPNMFASVAIETPARRQVLQVPDDAVVLLQGQPSVFVAEGKGFEARAVQTGDKFGGQTTIRSGLKPGEQVVVSGAYALKARMLKSQIGDAD